MRLLVGSLACMFVLAISTVVAQRDHERSVSELRTGEQTLANVTTQNGQRASAIADLNAELVHL